METKSLHLHDFLYTTMSQKHLSGYQPRASWRKAFCRLEQLGVEILRHQNTIKYVPVILTKEESMFYGSWILRYTQDDETTAFGGTFPSNRDQKHTVYFVCFFMPTITCIDLDKNTYEVEASALSWRPSVYAIIVQDNKILLSPQWDGYDLPGGGINLGETIEEALIREVKEETGLDVTMDTCIDTQSSFFRTISKKRYIHSILIYASATVTWWTLSTDGFDEEEQEYARLAEWIPLSHIKSINFKSSVEILPILEKALWLIN